MLVVWSVSKHPNGVLRLYWPVAGRGNVKSEGICLICKFDLRVLSVGLETDMTQRICCGNRGCPRTELGMVHVAIHARKRSGMQTIVVCLTFKSLPLPFMDSCAEYSMVTLHSLSQLDSTGNEGSGWQEQPSGTPIHAKSRPEETNSDGLQPSSFLLLVVWLFLIAMASNGVAMDTDCGHHLWSFLVSCDSCEV